MRQLPCRRRWLWVAVVLAMPTVAAAHVRWFVPETYPPNWNLLFSWPSLAVAALALVLYIALRGLQHVAGTPHFPNPSFLKFMAPSASILLAVQTGISLVYFASQRQLFVPGLDLPPTLFGWLLVALQIAVAFTFITGLFDRAGALLLIVVFLLGFFIFPPVFVLEQTLYVGIGITLFVLGRTIPPRAVARRLLRLGDFERSAVMALRVLTGFSVTLLGFSEKLLAPEAGLAFLREYPQFNVFQSLLGWGWFSDVQLVQVAGIVEATIGILLMTGVLTRLVILGMWVPFNLTVSFLPPIEILGHLPIFGIMFVLLLYGSGIAPQARAQLLEPALRGDELPDTGKIDSRL